MLKNLSKLVIGLITPGFSAYWPQMPHIKEEILSYSQEVSAQLSRHGRVVYAGIVDDPVSARAAAEYLAEHKIDILFIHMATYAPSKNILRALHGLSAPIITLHLQPVESFSEVTESKYTLPKNSFSAGGELSNVLLRSGCRFNSIVGRLRGDDHVWQTVSHWCEAAAAKKALSYSNIALIGNFFPGMSDLYADLTRMTALFGINIELHEMAQLRTHIEAVTDDEIKASYARTCASFDLIGDVSAEKLYWSNQVSVGLQKYVEHNHLQAIAFHYSGYPDSIEEKIGYSMTLGGSFLTVDGIPCLAEGDILLAIPMLILGYFADGSTQSEINVCDYIRDFSYVGHAGPGNFALSQEKPLLRWLDFFHGKKGSGVSCEFSLRQGPVTLLSLVQGCSGQYRFIVTEAEAITGNRLKNGNVNTCIQFKYLVADFYARWIKEGPSHHSAMGLGHHAGDIRRLADIMNIECIEI